MLNSQPDDYVCRVRKGCYPATAVTVTVAKEEGFPLRPDFSRIESIVALGRRQCRPAVQVARRLRRAQRCAV